MTIWLLSFTPLGRRASQRVLCTCTAVSRPRLRPAVDRFCGSNRTTDCFPAQSCFLLTVLGTVCPFRSALVRHRFFWKGSQYPAPYPKSCPDTNRQSSSEFPRFFGPSAIGSK